MERFGRYVLLEKLATGGMGEVYRAAAVGTAGFAKPLAIKRILPHLAEQQDFVNMLIDEAKISSSLTHPNILQVLDLGKHQGLYFIAMEFVAGQPLNRVLGSALRNQVRLPLEFCWQVIMEALKGLAFAHEKTDALGRSMGIIHRDISPQNILIGYDGTVRLADFGIAKAADRMTNTTTTGQIKGKPGYVAPEQVTGGDMDQRLDVYAMGVTLWEALAMRRMRKADNEMQVLLKAAEGTHPTFEALGVDVPPNLARVVYRALAKDPAERWPTARQFADALYAVLRDQGWHVQAVDVANMMREYFPSETERERESQAHFGRVITELAAADEEEVSAILERNSDVREVVKSGFDTPVSGRMPITVGNEDATRVAGGTPPPTLPTRSTGVVMGVAAGAMVAALGFWGLSRAAGGTQALPAHGTLVVETAPVGARVSVAGNWQASVSPVVVRALPPGPTDVEVSLEGYQPQRQVVDIPSGSTRTLSLTLARAAPAPAAAAPAPVAERPANVDRHTPRERPRPRPAPSPAPVAAAGGNDEPGQLDIQSEPWGRIYLDGKDTGRFTPAAGMTVSAGTHVVKLVNPDLGVSAETRVTVKPGATVKVSRELK